MDISGYHLDDIAFRGHIIVHNFSFHETISVTLSTVYYLGYSLGHSLLSNNVKIGRIGFV